MNNTTTWKTAKAAFAKQLELNLTQIDNPPGHWKHIHEYVGILYKVAKPDSVMRIVDYGCGVGAISRYLLRDYTQLYYLGLDNADEAVLLAKTWFQHNPQAAFVCVDDIVPKHIFPTYAHTGPLPVGAEAERNPPVDLSDRENMRNVGLANGLIDICENGEEVLDALLEKDHEVFILSRLRLTTQPSFAKRYVAYDEIETCEYFLNTTDFQNLLDHHKYVIRKRHTYDVQGTSIVQPTSCQLDCLLSKPE